jgi:hypothetical protein
MATDRIIPGQENEGMRATPGTLLAVVGASVTLSCSAPTEPDPVIGQVHIERVDVRILESSPPQAVAHVEGVLGDGCTELHSLQQRRAGSVVVVTILNQRPRDAICTMIAKLYSADIPLEGQYPPGRYVVRVNGIERAFQTE